MMPISRDQILQYVQQQTSRPLKARELARALQVPQAEYRAFRQLLKDLEQEGVLVRLRSNRYGPPEKLNLTAGRLSVNPDGFGFVSRDTGGPDIFVNESSLKTALHGDRVVIRVTNYAGRRNQPEGEIVRVLERAVKSVVGTYRFSDRFGFVEPDDPRLTRDIYISPEDSNGATEGQKVVAHIEAWTTGRSNPEGRIVEILGDAGDPGIDILAVVKEYDLPIAFPPHIQAAAEEIPDEIPASEILNRLDLRSLACVTIDPADAKDHDDALSLETLDNGTFRLGIHIADVSHYVTEGSLLDHEALTRGTSVYLPDRVIPMLPERLSGDLCSLLPQKDRLAFSVLVNLNSEAKIQNVEIAESVIRSRARLSYEEVQQVFDNAQNLPEQVRPHAGMLRKMETLRRQFTSRRARRGAIDFNIPEPRIILDEKGNTVDVERRERLDSHRLVEEFMLLANETVARRMEELDVPILFRVHDRPDKVRLETFSKMAAGFGYRFPRVDRITPAGIQKFLQTLTGKRSGDVLNAYLLRSMKKAIYTPENIGHFGLACDSYTHFPSPIRRYPDLLTHRLVREANTLTEQRKAQLKERLPTIGDLATKREIVAQEAEWDAIKIKQIRFLEKRVGEHFKATIVSVRAMGFFAQLDECLIDGMVRVSSLADDYYIYQETRGALVGERTGRTFRMGDSVVVELARADLQTRRIDFLLLEGGIHEEQEQRQKPDRKQTQTNRRKPKHTRRSRSGRKKKRS